MQTCLVNVSIDDVSPHPLSSVKVINECLELIQEFPEIKFTLFVPTSYWRTIKEGTATQNPLQIDLFPEFCQKIRDLPDENFEIGFHGHHHGIPGKTDNDELKNLNYDQAGQLINAMREVVKRADLQHKFKPIIRPPAWRMSPDSIRRFRDEGFTVFALSPLDYAIETYGGEQEKRNDVVYHTASPPFSPLSLESKTEIVYHACEWDKNYLSPELSAELKIFLRENSDKISFCFMGDLV